MARQTRAQRRARREGRADNGIAPPRRPDRPIGNGQGPPEHRPEPARPTVHHEKRRFSFVREAVAELQKVEWPNQSQLIQGTVVVLIACIIVGFYLWGVDQGFRRFVHDVLI